jgi:tRNA (guanine-N7-)-methyltransferase
MKNNYRYGSLAAFIDIGPWDWASGEKNIFPPRVPVEVEIGFGTGEYLAALAGAAPQSGFIGFEQCPGRIIKTLRKLFTLGLGNARIFRIDAAWGFRFFMGKGAVDRVHCLFPCPWPKKRHAKHRLFQPDFLRLVRSRLKDGGTLRIVTDHHPYADWIEAQLPLTGFSCRRSMIGAVHGTKFEKKWKDGGQEVFDELVLTADQPYDYQDAGGGCVKTYFSSGFNARQMRLEGVQGPLTVSFPDEIYDDARRSGIVHAIVSEDGRMQHVWVRIDPTAKGWRVAPAEGTAVLPTEGVQKAVEMVFRAVEKSG